MTIDEIILESVDDAAQESEINVLLAIGECYSKALSIAEENDFKDLIVMESCIFESADTTSETKGSSIKALFQKVVNFIKTTFKKISNMLSKRYVSSKRDIFLVGNMLKIMEKLKTAKLQPKPVKEYDINDIDDEIYQEGLFKTPEEKEKAKKDKESHKMAKSLKKQFKNEIYLRELSSVDIDAIVLTVTRNISDEDFKKLQDAIKAFEKDQFKKLDEGTLRNMTTIMKLAEYVGKMNETMENILESGYFDKKTSNKKRETDKAVENNIKKQASRKGQEKIIMDLKLVEKFSNTLGQVLDSMSHKSNFTYENCKRIVYGGKPIRSGLAATADCLFGIFNRSNELIPKLNRYGEMLYEFHHELADYVDEDEQYRKEMGIELNKTIKVLMFNLDNIKEETYGWDDDPFNRQSYGACNIHTLNAGGPFSIACKLTMTCLTGDPSWMGMPGEVSPVDLGLMAVAKSLRPTPTH